MHAVPNLSSNPRTHRSGHNHARVSDILAREDLSIASHFENVAFDLAEPSFPVSHTFRTKAFRRGKVYCLCRMDYEDQFKHSLAYATHGILWRRRSV